jgi:hypothetical protein
MKRKSPKPDDPEQSKRFIETAREVGAAETDEGAKETFKNVVRRMPAEKQKNRP